jgi:hypothetical protein
MWQCNVNKFEFQRTLQQHLKLAVDSAKVRNCNEVHCMAIFAKYMVYRERSSVQFIKSLGFQCVGRRRRASLITPKFPKRP